MSGPSGDAGQRLARGRFIVFEGVEGAGKSTQARLTAAWLDAAGIPHLLTREPGGTWLGEEVRRLVLEAGDVAIRSELLLMLAARAALVEEVVAPALERGTVVLADRYELSTLAYQAAGRGLDATEVKRINAFATGGVRPDLTILVDVALGEGVARGRAADTGSDRIERAGPEFHEKVARAYRLLAETEPDVAVVDGMGPAERVQERVRSLLSGRFPETFARAQG